MGWEKRGNRLYYYEKIRLGDQVVSRYVGTEENADLINDAILHRQMLKQQRRQERLKSEQELAAARAIQETTSALLKATMLASGFRLHRGSWRKRNG